MRRPGPYQVQAAIAAVHDRASSAETTDWREIVGLYAALQTLAPSAVVELNRAVALAFAEGPAAGLAELDRVGARGSLVEYHLFHAARADLLRRLGRRAEAATAYRRALQLATNRAERRFLARRLADVGGRPG